MYTLNFHKMVFRKSNFQMIVLGTNNQEILLKSFEILIFTRKNNPKSWEELFKLNSFHFIQWICLTIMIEYLC